jgi:hypothetical protein
MLIERLYCIIIPQIVIVAPYLAVVCRDMHLNHYCAKPFPSLTHHLQGNSPEKNALFGTLFDTAFPAVFAPCSLVVFVLIHEEEEYIRALFHFESPVVFRDLNEAIQIPNGTVPKS